MNRSIVIRGLGHYAPPKILTNADLEKMVDTSDEWIITRTGIKTRHICEPGTGVSDLAFEAAKNALDAAGMKADELTHILLGTLTPDYPCPSGANLLMEKLGVSHIMSLDCNAACSGFLYTLQVGRAMVALEPDAKVLVAAGEILSCRTNWEDRTTCVLFGDGAGAAVVTADTEQTATAPKGVIKDIILSSDGGQHENLVIPAGGSKNMYRAGDKVEQDYFIYMNGREVFKHAVRNMESICRKILERNNLSMDDVDILIPHQANLRIIEALAKKLQIEHENVFINVDRYGNTSAASVPIAFSEAINDSFIKEGDLVLITTFGAGFTWGAALVQY